MRDDEMARGFESDREIVRITRDALDEGRTRQQVYEELSRGYDAKEYLAQIIARVPEAEARAKYRTANKVLVTLMVITCSLNLLLALLGMINRMEYRRWAFNPVFALVLLTVVFEVRRMNNAHIYLAVGLLSLAGVLQATMLSPAQALWGLTNVLLLATIAGLSFYLREHLRSGWRPSVPAPDVQDPSLQ